MESYFRGGKPFSGKKNRNDIPDGFIYTVIEDIAKKEGFVHVVTDDGTLKKSANSLENSRVYSSIDNYIDENELRELVIDPVEYSFVVEMRKEVTNRSGEGLKNKIKDTVRDRIPKYLNGEWIDSQYTSRKANIDDVISIGKVDVNTNNLNHYSEDTIRVPFGTDCTVILSWKTLYDEYSEPEQRESPRDQWRTGRGSRPMVEIAEQFLLHVDGFVVLEMEGIEYESVNPSSIDGYLDDIKLDIDKIINRFVVIPKIRDGL
jgi:hypothetical protein